MTAKLFEGILGQATDRNRCYMRTSVFRREKILFSDQSTSVRHSSHVASTPLFMTTESTTMPSRVQNSLQIPVDIQSEV
jgi:hypothetical protein